MDAQASDSGNADVRMYRTYSLHDNHRRTQRALFLVTENQAIDLSQRDDLLKFKKPALKAGFVFLNGFVRIKIRLFCDFVTEKIFQVGYTVIENKFREVKYGSINHYKK